MLDAYKARTRRESLHSHVLRAMSLQARLHHNPFRGQPFEERAAAAKAQFVAQYGPDAWRRLSPAPRQRPAPKVVDVTPEETLQVRTCDALMHVREAFKLKAERAGESIV